MPTDAEKESVMAEIRAAVTAHAEYSEAAGKEAALRKAAEKIDDPATRDDWMKVYEKAGKARDLWQSKAKKAFKLSQDLYKLEAPTGSHPIVGGPLKGTGIEWAPEIVADEDRVLRSRPDPTGKQRYLGFETAEHKYASTGEDGKVVIRMRTLSKSLELGDPGFLAAALVHEEVHFSDLTTSGWKSKEIDEAKAWAAEAKFAEKFVVSTNKELLEGILDAIKRTAAEYHGRSLFGHLRLAFGGKGDAYMNTDQESKNKSAFERLEKERLGISERQKKLKARVEEDRRRREETRRVRELIAQKEEEHQRLLRAMPPAISAAPPPPKSPIAPSMPESATLLMSIDNLLTRLCRDPEDQGDFNHWLRALDRFRNEDSGFKSSLNRSIIPDVPSSPVDRCVAAMIDSIPDPPAPVDLDFFRAKARESLRPSPRPHPSSAPSEPADREPPPRPRCRYQGDWCR